MAASRFKSPVRVSITLPWSAYERLIAESQSEGRSISNLAAYLIESSLQDWPSCPPVQSRAHNHSFH